MMALSPRNIPQRGWTGLKILALAGITALARGGGTVASTVGARREYSIVLWNWTAPCANLNTFRRWARDGKHIGVTTITISVPWNKLEPQRGRYEFSYIARRLASAHKLGLRLRVLINTYYNGVRPGWLKVDNWRGPHGHTLPNSPASINDPRFWKAWEPLCTRLAAKFRGRHVIWSPFIGPDGELKYGGWATFDQASLRLWRKSIAAHLRPGWLKRVVGGARLPATPPMPGPTHGLPDRNPADRAFIAFRQHTWRVAVRRFVRAIRQGDPHGFISVPLGESYRSQSAKFANLDYYGLSRGANEIVHSWDFYMHSAAHPHEHQAWEAAASIAAFQGITGLPALFEFDSPATMRNDGFSTPLLEHIARDVLQCGGHGFQAANFSYFHQMPSQYPFLAFFGKILSETPAYAPAPPNRTVLLFVSKWADYSYRESTDWLHQAQFGAWRMLRRNGYAVRFICEDDLRENLTGYRGLYVAFSPPQLIPPYESARLAKLEHAIPSIVEEPGIPAVKPGRMNTYTAHTPIGRLMTSDVHLPVAPMKKVLRTGPGRRVVLGYPLGYMWICGHDHPAQQRALKWAIQRTWGWSR